MKILLHISGRVLFGQRCILRGAVHFFGLLYAPQDLLLEKLSFLPFLLKRASCILQLSKTTTN